ncbi:hypothetical protein [Kitasatospora sp. NPDC088134]|uniref:hypothetical protein n=1 Tax=Kitasatospora sp. NPDC088134 TaxID=3364071 RepID=UPI00380EB26E
MDRRAGTPGGRTRPWWDSRGARVAFVLAGLPPVLLGFLLFVGAFEERAAYRSAPLCGTPAPGPDADCLLAESGRVTAKRVSDSIEDGTGYYLRVARGTGPTEEYEVDEFLHQHVESGSAVDLKVWKGLVVRIAVDGHEVGVPTLSRQGWLGLAGATLLIALGTVVTSYGLPGRNPPFPRSAPLLLMGTTLVTAMGTVLLALVQWPFPLTLGLAAAAWLVATATLRYLHTSFV